MTGPRGAKGAAKTAPVIAATVPALWCPTRHSGRRGSPLPVRVLGAPGAASWRSPVKLLDNAGRPTVPTARCGSCHAEVVWVHTRAGERMPINPSPSPLGNLRLDLHGRQIFATVTPDATPDMFDPNDSGVRYLSHFATCPEADEWRQP